MSKDEVDLVASILAAAPSLSPGLARAIAFRIQADIGGAYLKKTPAEGKAWGLGNALAAGVPLAQAFVDVGVSRASGYRLLRRRWGRRAA